MNKMTGNAVMDTFFMYITHAGDGIVALIIIAITLLMNARNGLFLFIAYAVSGLITTAIKNLSPESFRPHFAFHEYLHSYPINYIDGVEMLAKNSFPSGHSTTAFAVFLSLALFTKNKALKVTFLLIAILSAFSRTYLSQHWLVDITVGSLIGFTTAVLFYFVLISPNRLQKINKPLMNIFNN
ncbi:MAG: phosphatase PAP2 family protein [Sphingobacteriaceae bacterium]|nr:phosphatase PAP2 family protein [Sphingobacteriaceae bacterium]